MAIDSTELTFVRCPSCRSLVPAVSTRCRMCGAGLDASGKSDQDAGSTNEQQHVRSRPAAPPLQGPPASVDSAPQQGVAPIESDPLGLGGGDESDPLAAYLLDEPIEDAAPASAPSAKAASRDPFALEDDLDIFDLDDEDDWGLSAAASEAPQTPEKPVHVPFEETQRETPAQRAAPEAKQSAHSERVAPPQIAKEPVAERQNGTRHSEPARVKVESGARPSGQPSGLSFGKGRSEQERKTSDSRPQQQESRSHDKPRQEQNGSQKQQRDDRREGRDTRRDDRQNRPERKEDRRRDERPESQPRREERRAEPRQESRSEPTQRGQSENRPQNVAPTPPRERTTSAAPQQHADRSTLVGWIVSYDSAEGKAMELRNGRFFVSGMQLKGSDLVLNDPNVSTPHALVAIGGRSPVQIQDLMSEHGVYLKRSGESQYERIQEMVSVDHGDWVRFGSVEYLIVLVPNRR